MEMEEFAPLLKVGETHCVQVEVALQAVCERFTDHVGPPQTFICTEPVPLIQILAV